MIKVRGKIFFLKEGKALSKYYFIKTCRKEKGRQGEGRMEVRGKNKVKTHFNCTVWILSNFWEVRHYRMCP